MVAEGEGGEKGGRKMEDYLFRLSLQALELAAGAVLAGQLLLHLGLLRLHAAQLQLCLLGIRLVDVVCLHRLHVHAPSLRHHVIIT